MMKIQNWIHCIYCLIIIISFAEASGQTNGFKGGLLFNANGIHIQGQDVSYWSGSKGEVWGTGGLSMGGFIHRNFSKHFFLSFELRYIRKGSIYEYVSEYGVVNYETLKLNYFELPLLIGYTFRPHGKYRIFETGFAISRMFSSQLELDELNQRKGTPGTNDFKNLDISWVGSFKVPLNRNTGNNLLFGIRVEHSIFTIHNKYKLFNFVYGIQLDFLI